MSVNLKPLGGNIAVEPLQEEEGTAFGIILPETAKEKPSRGLVVAVGPGRRMKNGERQPMDIKVGDTVLYAKYAGSTFKFGDRELLILSDDEVQAILG